LIAKVILYLWKGFEGAELNLKFGLIKKFPKSVKLSLPSYSYPLRQSLESVSPSKASLL